MSSYYYYLISSLPMLSTSSNVITYEEFLALCSNGSSKLYCALKDLTLANAVNFKGCPLVSEFGRYYSSMMGELSIQRRKSLGKTPASASFDCCPDSSVSDAVTAAINAENPLKAEYILIDAQFRYLDSLSAMHFFDDYVLFSYALKLRLLERKLIFSAQRGKLEFDRLYNSLQSQISVV